MVRINKMKYKNILHENNMHIKRRYLNMFTRLTRLRLKDKQSSRLRFELYPDEIISFY